MILDSNILIYACSDEHPEIREFIRENVPSVSIITMVETLGYHLLAPAERSQLETFFDIAFVLDVTHTIADRAILLRQTNRVSLGDSLIAATALVHGQALATHNTSDFSWIEELELVDPLGSR